MSDRAGLVATALHGTLLLYFCFAMYKYRNIYSDVIYQPQYKESLKTALVLQEYKYSFLTCWNFGFEMVFLSLVIVERLAVTLNWNVLLRSWLNKLRSFLFSAIIFPLSIIVASVFWSVSLYDRHLMLPKDSELYFPTWMNHTMHTIILLPLVVEIFVMPKTDNFVQFGSAFRSLTVLLGCYELIFGLIYFNHGLFLYPIYYKLTTAQIFLFTSLVYFYGISALYLGIYLQNLKKNANVLSMEKNKIK